MKIEDRQSCFTQYDNSWNINEEDNEKNTNKNTIKNASKNINKCCMRSVFLLSACSKQIEQQQTNMADETPSEDMIKKSAELGSFGIKLDARDESVKPVMTFLNMLAALGIKTG